MTITPTATTPTAAPPAVLPTAGPDPATAGTAATVPGDFVALVQQALVAALGGTPAGAKPSPARGAGATADPSPGQPGDGTADASLVAAANGLVAVVPPVPVASVAPAAARTASAAGAPVDAAPARPQLTLVPAGPHPSDGKARPDGVAADAGTALPVAAPGAGATEPGGGTGTPADPGAGQQAPAAPVAVAAATPAAAPAAPLPTGASAPAQAAAPVAGQVFPEVTSLVTRGDGTHRITLTLKPEALGEVRVVMTVRDGSVHVRLAAGHEAQQALLAGSSELSRLLEHAGATDTRIVVRDLAGAAAPATGSSNDRGADLGHAPGSSLGAGDHRSQDQHAGTRAEHHATDGTHDTTTAGAMPSRPVQPATRTRTAGVDVTM